MKKQLTAAVMAAMLCTGAVYAADTTGAVAVPAQHGSLTLAIKEKRCEASKMAYFFVNFSIFFLSNV